MAKTLMVDGKEIVLNDAVSNLINQGILISDDEGLFFQRQLEFVEAKSYDVLYPELKGRSTFSLNTVGGEGVETLTYRSYDKRGEAQIISGNSTDLPRSDISGKEFSITVKTIGTAYGYTRQELAAAKLTGMPLDARRAEASKRSYEEKVNQLIWFGDEETEINGLFGGKAGDPWSYITNTEVAGSASGANSTVWGVDKSADEVIADLNFALTKMVVDSKQVHMPNKILMSIAKFNYLMNTPYHLAGGVTVGSILSFFLANNAYIKSVDQIQVINELDGVYGAIPGFGAGSQGFTVISENADNLEVMEPFPYMQLPVQYSGLEFEINCYGRFAGLQIRRPMAISHWYGV